MRIGKTRILIFSLLVLAGCAGTIPDSGLSGGGGNFRPDTVEYFNASVGDRVFFAVNQSSLSPEAMSVLDAQADWLNRNRQFGALIEGHADEQGTREYNLALGARRASSVKAYLVSRGVAESRLSTVTYGKERPVETCSAEVCWSKNRRAVTVVTAAGAS